jgi:DNA polymerase
MQEARMGDLAALRLQIEWGADEALEDAPVARLGVVAAPAPARAAEPRLVATMAPMQPAGPVPRASSAAGRAAAAAARAATLEELRAAVAAFDGCVLRDTASNLVFAAGRPRSGLLLAGDAPDAEEDRSGIPFSGPQGELLDRMLASIGLARDSVLATQVIPWRPPGGRPPSASEITICLPFLHRLIVLDAPERLVLFGLAGKALLGAGSRRRSQAAWAPVDVPGLDHAVRALALPSLAEVRSSAAARRSAWAGLRLLRRTMDEAAR